MIEELFKDLAKNGKNERTWIELARSYSILPERSDNERADYIRKAWKRHTDNQVSISKQEYQTFLKWKSSKSISNLPSLEFLDPYLNGDPNNVLVIGDLHEPFSLNEYLPFCRSIQEEYNCGKVVFIGDIIDSFWDSFWDKSIDTDFTRTEELDNALVRLNAWYYTFPIANVCLGNHDLRMKRKAEKAGLSVSCLKDFKDVVSAPKSWRFGNEFIFNNVLYIHGSSSSAYVRSKNEMMSLVQGHRHTEMGIKWYNSRVKSIFGMQVGCGIDYDAECFNYSRENTAKPIIGAGVVLNSGKLPIIIKL